MPGASWGWAARAPLRGAGAAVALALACAPCAARDAADCAGIDSERQRLRCYDEVVRPGAEVPDRNSYLVRSWKLGDAERPRLGVL